MSPWRRLDTESHWSLFLISKTMPWKNKGFFFFFLKRVPWRFPVIFMITCLHQLQKNSVFIFICTFSSYSLYLNLIKFSLKKETNLSKLSAAIEFMYNS